MMSWLGFGLVALHLYLLACNEKRAGWSVCVAACIIWGLVALWEHLPALLCQQLVILGIAAKGLRS